MTTLDPRTRRIRRTATVDLAGTAWPLYKLEAVVAGAATVLILFVIVRDAQTAVLGAAAIATLTWFTRLAHYRNAADRPATGTAGRTTR